MKEVKILCDHCQRDLTSTGNSIDWRLSLNVEPIKSKGGWVTDMFIYKPIKNDCHFCGVSCLKKWLENEDNYKVEF